MHEDITVSDNSLFFLPAERFSTHAPAHFYFHYYFCISVQIGSLAFSAQSPPTSRKPNRGFLQKRACHVLYVHVSTTRSENVATFLSVCLSKFKTSLCIRLCAHPCQYMCAWLSEHVCPARALQPRGALFLLTSSVCIITRLPGLGSRCYESARVTNDHGIALTTHTPTHTHAGRHRRRHNIHRQTPNPHILNPQKGCRVSVSICYPLGQHSVSGQVFTGGDGLHPFS